MLDLHDLSKDLRNFLGENSKVGIQKISRELFDIIAISPQFTGLNSFERENLVQHWIQSLNYRNLKVSLMSLYSPKEAEILEVDVDWGKNVTQPSTWFELINWGYNQRQLTKSNKSSKVIAFYSYKGGVGRTTTLIHVAWTLASRGKRVVMVDLDFEAPSLHLALGKIKVQPQKGFVDYIYERMNIINELPIIQISDIIGEISVPKGGLFYIPAGYVNDEYISKVDDLRKLPVNNEDLWVNFRTEIENQLAPDLILIDSRTGINIWGALSILAIADDSLIFMNPNTQNTEGISAVVSSLKKVGLDPNIVLTPVLGGKLGRERALKEWRKLNNIIDNSKSDLNDNNFELNDLDEPIMIPYASDIALADEYPHKPMLSLYLDITNILDNESDKHKLIHILASHERWKVIESLNFPSVDAKNEKNPVEDLFQKTTDFDRFLDQTTVLVRGKKGTGKTQLYWTTLKYFEVIKKLAQGRVENVLPVSGHGPATSHPIKDDFSYVHKQFSKENLDLWESFWRIYALIRLVTVKGISIGVPRHYREFIQKLKGIAENASWTSENTELIVKLTKNDEYRLKSRDLLKVFNDQLKKKNQIVWLLYDDLDQDIQENTQVQNNAISGLFEFSLMLEGLEIRNIRPKILLRSDIWHRLNFTNKSHFVGRDMELKWTREDFLRLAIRQARLSSEFSELMAKFAPVSDIDNSPEEILEKGLELLWGINREKGRKSKKVSRWVYERLTDASGSTFPRALTVLLQGAKENEMSYLAQPHVQAPTDRLLRSQSLNVGLIKASQARCDELRQEHKDLDELGFFTFLSQLGQITELTPLEEWWKEIATFKFKTFKDFLEQIEQMGLASQYDINRWRFADIYVHGFNMSRSSKF